MTSALFRELVAGELATIGVAADRARYGPARTTKIDPTLPGFGRRTYTSGRVVYIVQHRIAGRMQSVTIGNAEVVPERVARDVARRVLLRAEVGDDPAVERIRVRAAPAFRDFLDEYWRYASKRWKPRTVETNDCYRRLYLDNAFADRFVDQIAASDVATWFARVTDASGPGGANRCMAVLAAMMRKAGDWGYRPTGDNPCDGVRRNRNRRCERFLSDAELAQLGAALIGSEATYPVHVAAIRLILLTGCRKSEILQLRWGDVKGQRLIVRDSKTGPRTVWLSKEARAVIDRLKRRKPEDAVLRFARPSRHVLDPFWARLRVAAELPDVRLHDLRHSFASFAARRSETLPMIGRLLGHAKIASTARYAHLDDGTLIEAAERIGRLIQQSCRCGLNRQIAPHGSL